MKKAESDLAFNLQAAKTRQKIMEEQMQVKVIERTQEIQVQEQEILRKERELEATIRRPAEAEKYRLEKLAEANRFVCRLYIPICNKSCVILLSHSHIRNDLIL